MICFVLNYRLWCDIKVFLHCKWYFIPFMHIQLLIILLVHAIPGDAYNDIIVKLIYVFVDL